MNGKIFLLNAGKAKDETDLNTEIINIAISLDGSNKLRGWNSRDGISPCQEENSKHGAYCLCIVVYKCDNMKIRGLGYPIVEFISPVTF